MDQRPRQLDGVEGVGDELLTLYRDGEVRWRCHGQVARAKTLCWCTFLCTSSEPVHLSNMVEIAAQTSVATHCDAIMWGRCGRCGMVHWGYALNTNTIDLVASPAYWPDQ